jgi:hypothetical protein
MNHFREKEGVGEKRRTRMEAESFVQLDWQQCIDKRGDNDPSQDKERDIVHATQQCHGCTT